MPDYNNLLDEEQAALGPLPTINPFYPPEQSEQTEKLKFWMAMISSALLAIGMIGFLFVEGGADWKKSLSAILGLLLFMGMGWPMMSYIFMGIINGFLLILGKLFVEPTKSRKFIEAYQYVYLDFYVGIILVNIFFFVIFITA